MEYDFDALEADEGIRVSPGAARWAALGVPVSGHDLRQSFGRITYHGGVSLVNLKYLYGHKSVDMTARDMGWSDDAARRGPNAFGDATGPLVRQVEMGAGP